MYEYEQAVLWTYIFREVVNAVAGLGHSAANQWPTWIEL